MVRSIFILCALVTAAVAVSGCSSAPTVEVPSGANRVPINDPTQLAAYQAQAEQADVDEKTRKALQTKLAVLEAQVRDLKAYILVQQAAVAINTPKGIPHGAGRKSGMGSASPSSAQGLPSTVDPVQVSDNSIIFTITHGTGQTAFKLPSELQANLLQAASASEHIEIRGRTDSDTDNPVDRRIARARARRAYEFLVSHGIPGDHIRVSFEAAGHFAVANETADGKARNRRVEVEAVGAGARATRQGA
jgi:outer membrane protein OmpA-like peptidoglycan-associated protein